MSFEREEGEERRGEEGSGGGEKERKGKDS
jgi:hypothetical protein